MSTTIGAWGKYNEKNNHRHPLVDHCLDVAVVFRTLLDLPLLAPLDRLTSVQKDRLAVLAFLHDFGKCNRGFQAKADPEARDTAGHIMEAVALLMELQHRWPEPWTKLLADVCRWFIDEEQAVQMLFASISHHGRPVSLNDYQDSGAANAAGKWWSATADYDPFLALVALASAARTAFPAAFREGVHPIDATAILQHRFAGLVMLADWIGSDTQFFPYREDHDEDRHKMARTAVDCALDAIGLMLPKIRSVKPFGEIFPFEPTPLQAALAERLETDADTRLLLAESDTGSGKTEAALAWFFRLYAEGKVGGLYFALPTRVAAREIYERVLRAIEVAFAPEACPGPVLLAAPGYVKVDGQSVDHILADPSTVLWDDSSWDRIRQRLWSSERPKRFLAAPIAVGTIDQVLLSALQVKHSLLRSVCLDRHLLVVDEVHASDPYMREVLKALLRGHLDRGGHALLLSATLGESAAAEYFDRPPAPLQEALTRPYPLLSSRTHAWPILASRERSIQVELAPILTNDEALLLLLVDALQQGARILVVCNTVARANALFRRVESTLAENSPELLSALFSLDGVRCPHHGRFAREDRELLDAAVTDQLGKGSPDGARLLIGTQTLEQSLDIDADWLVTDLAPMDVLIQRLGRLHRHARARRPAQFEIPRVLVRVPDRDLAEYLGKDHNLKAPAGLGSVYGDGRVLACTWAELRQRPVIALPQQARELVELTTHPEALEGLPETWCAYGHSVVGKELEMIRQGMHSVLENKPFGELHYPDKRERIATRLGQPTLDLPLRSTMTSPFGVSIFRVSIPAHWAPEGHLPESVAVEPYDEGFRFSVGKTPFHYTRFGLEKDDA